MKREECEELIIEKLREIMDVYHAYHPKGDFLSLYVDSGSVSGFNAHYGRDVNYPISFFRRNEG